MLKFISRLIAKQKLWLEPDGRNYAIIGDAGLIIANIKQGQIKGRYFFQDITEKNASKIKQILAKFPRAPIYLLACHNDQEYKIQAIPAVNFLSVGNLVKKRLQREFNYEAEKQALYLWRDEHNHKDFVYLFAACGLTSPLAEWYQLFTNSSTHLKSLNLIPVETASLLAQINQQLELKGQQTSKFQMLITQHKVSSFRQSVFHHGQLFFTRLVKEEEEYHDVIAGNIQHEIFNTIEYLRRNGLEDNNNIDVIIIVESEVKKKLHNNRIKVNNLLIKTPYDVAQLINCEQAVKNNDRFADLLIIAAIDRCRMKMPIKTKELVAMNLATDLQFYAKYVAKIIIIIATIIGVSNYKALKSTEAKLNLVSNNNSQLGQQIVQLEFQNRKLLGKGNKVRELVRVYEYITGDIVSPVGYFSSMSKILTYNMVVNKINWFALPRVNRADSKRRFREVKLVFDLDIRNNERSYDELFYDLNSFEQEIKSNFKNHVINFIRLDRSIDLQQGTEAVIPIELTIRTKHES